MHPLNYRWKKFWFLLLKDRSDGVLEAVLTGRHGEADGDVPVALSEEPRDLLRDHFLERGGLGRRSSPCVGTRAARPYCRFLIPYALTPLSLRASYVQRTYVSVKLI